MDDQPTDMNGDPIIGMDDIDHIADRIYDEAGTETDISPLLEEEP